MGDGDICEYCERAFGEWDDEAGTICKKCLADREAKKQAELEKYDERESNP